jgi:hypothetical protein
VILDEVAAEMNRIVALFRKHCRHFSGAFVVGVGVGFGFGCGVD